MFDCVHDGGVYINACQDARKYIIYDLCTQHTHTHTILSIKTFGIRVRVCCLVCALRLVWPYFPIGQIGPTVIQLCKQHETTMWVCVCVCSALYAMNVLQAHARATMSLALCASALSDTNVQQRFGGVVRS